MRRQIAALGLLLAASLAWLMLWGSPVVGQPPSGALQPFGGVRIIGRHNQVANVNHTGQLAVEATVNATVTTDNVNVFHQSTVAHISSVTHALLVTTGKLLKRHVGVFGNIVTGDVDAPGGSSLFLAGVASKGLYIYSYAIQSRIGTMAGQFADGTAGTTHLTLRWSLPVHSGAFAQSAGPPGYLFKTSSGNGLYLWIRGSGIVDADVSYWEE